MENVLAIDWVFVLRTIVLFCASFWMTISVISELLGDRERAKLRALWAIFALLFVLVFQGI